MILNQLKARHKTASRGYQLLKDKRDELMRQFLAIMQEAAALRSAVEQGLGQTFSALSMAGAVMTQEALEQALLYPVQKIRLQVQTRNIMSVRIPIYAFSTEEMPAMQSYPYGFAQTSGELDAAMDALQRTMPDLLKLAELEKAIQLLAAEIERTRRRVNALEYVIIPELEENIRFIAMKLEESNLSTKVRLMKIKDMVLQKARRSF